MRPWEESRSSVPHPTKRSSEPCDWPGLRFSLKVGVGSSFRGKRGSPGRSGWFPTQPPHRSVLAQLTHTAPRFKLRRHRYPLSFRGQSTGSDAPVMFPFNGRLKRRPHRSVGSFGRVPPLPRYYGTLRLPAVRFAALRCLRWAIPPLRPIRSHRPGRAAGGTGSWYSGSRAGNVSGNGRVSQVPERPSCPRALFLDPGRTENAKPWRRLGTAPACVNNGGSRERRFRGSIARHRDSLSTLRSGGRPPPRKTRFRLLARLCRAGFVNPQGCSERFQSSSLFLLSRAYLTL
jgi:hypothetical protein